MARVRLELQNFSTELLDVGSGPAVLLLHSIGLDKELWSDVIPWLRPRCRVVTYDLRGHGGASPMQSFQDIATHASDLAAILDYLQIERAHVVGLSFGGAVAQEFALTFPTRVDTLTLIATIASGLPVFAERAQTASREGIGPSIASTLERWFSREAIEDGAPCVRYAGQRLKALDVNTWVRCWTSLACFDRTSLLTRYVMPVHIIAGSKDASTPPEVMRKIADAIPGARFSVISGAPHLAPLEFPKTVAAAITTLFDDEPGAGPWLAATELAGNPDSLARTAGKLFMRGGVDIFTATNAGKAWILTKGASQQDAMAAHEGLMEFLRTDTIEVSTSLVARRIGAYGNLDKDAPCLLPIGMPVPSEDLAELDRWYREEHVKMLLKSRDWHSIERYEVNEICDGGWTRLMLHSVASPMILDDPDVRKAVTTPWRNQLAERPWFLAGARHIYQRVASERSGNEAGR